jgi:hypothetical protein
MKDTPPYLTDAQVDATYNEACVRMFGMTESPSTQDQEEEITASTITTLRREISDLRKRVGQQHCTMTPYEPPSTPGTMEGKGPVA